jgi:hypothetical protein
MACYAEYVSLLCFILKNHLLVFGIKERDYQEQHTQHNENDGLRNGVKVPEIVEKKFEQCQRKEHNCPDTKVQFLFPDTHHDQQ